VALSTDPIIDWARFTNERPHVLVRGTDFERSPELVRKAAGMWAYRNGFRCATSIAGAMLTVQFIPREAANV
jgi:hypothetical protein